MGRAADRELCQAHEPIAKALTRARPSEAGLEGRPGNTGSRGRSPVGTGNSQPSAFKMAKLSNFPFESSNIPCPARDPW